MDNSGTKPSASPVLTAYLQAGDALRLIFSEQLSALRKHTPGARLGRDPEELHDLRVAVRRTRSALNQFRKLLPEPVISHFGREFRWVAEITGPVRDLDVYLDHIPEYSNLLARGEAEALEPFRCFLRKQRRLEQRRLARRLGSNRYSRLIADWQDFLGNHDLNNWSAKALRPAGEVARRRIWKLYGDFIRQGEAVNAATPDRALHRLRITGKKLRYLVEFFRPLHPATEVTVLVKAMKVLQDYLGTYQDCTVQQERLHALAELMAEGGQMPEATATALQQLIDLLHQRQRRLRREFPQRFSVFSNGRGRRGFVRLYAPAERP